MTRPLNRFYEFIRKPNSESNVGSNLEFPSYFNYIFFAYLKKDSEN